MSPRDIKAAAATSPAVAIAVVVMAGLVALAALAAVCFLVWQQRSASDILSLVNLLLSGAAVKVANDARSLAAQVKDQTNGTQTLLIEKATQSK